jgi:hypothetical protein
LGRLGNRGIKQRQRQQREKDIVSGQQQQQQQRELEAKVNSKLWRQENGIID